MFNLDQVNRFVQEGVGAVPAAPYNTFGHGRTLAGPADTFVTINNDTLYSMASLDLSVGPVVLEVPDTAGRYYVFQFVDAWTNNFAYIGHRATGTGHGRFLLVPPGYSGEVEDGITVITCPTAVASIVGRWACDGDDDLAAVHALQDATSLTQLDPAALPVGLPEPVDGVSAGLLFFEKLRLWSQAYPPAERDKALQETLSPLKIDVPGDDSPYVGAEAGWVAELEAGAAAGERTLETALTSGSSPEVNGWKLTFHAFDYNLDFFEIGTLDGDEYKISDPTLRIVERAAAAKGGLWGNHAYEAAYIMTYVDDRGDQLVGSSTYTLTLNPVPPVNAFWSLTMYDIPDFYLVDNPINRYSIGDRTPGLDHADDGSLTIVISNTAPENTANWLPAPPGEFRPVLRMYEPDPAVLSREYEVPAIVRVD
ncbi:DUF1254 domain-containing protein [Williamsia sp.]|uniref:DUF1254 domain-containing protein n=1 Tax=Williamsia sp. TaxID=1872085 RepID=UPI002F95DE2A